MMLRIFLPPPFTLCECLMTGDMLNLAYREESASLHDIRYRIFAKSENVRRSPLRMTTLKAAAARSRPSTASNPSSRPSPIAIERGSGRGRLADCIADGMPPAKSGSSCATTAS
jgi:hypothetical protein